MKSYTIKNIENKDQKIILTLNESLYFRKKLLIENSETNKVLLKKVSGHTIKISLFEIEKFGEIKTLKFFVVDSNGKYPIRVTNKFEKLLFLNNDFSLSFYKNSTRDLIAKVYMRKVNWEIEKLDCQDQLIVIEGRLLSDISNYKKLNLELSINSTARRHKTVFPIDLTNDKFKVEVNIKKLPYVFTNDRWNLFMEFKDGEEILMSEPCFYGQNGEEKYINVFTINEENKEVLALYEPDNLRALSLWYTTENEQKKASDIYDGTKIYYEYLQNHQIDDKSLIFEGFLGNSYSGNPKYLLEELLRNKKYSDYKPTLVYNDDPSKLSLDPRVKVVARNSVEYFKVLATSKYWINNVIFSVKDKPVKTTYLQTWHGTPLKKLGWDIDILGPEVLARQNFYNESRNWDMLMSANKYSTEIFKRAFKFEKEMIELGYPINDIYYHDNSTISDKIRQQYKIPKNKKVILYAPTWRDDQTSYVEKNVYQLPFDSKKFEKELGSEYVLLVKLHHLIDEVEGIETKSIINVSDYDDVQELGYLADILITDYSSVFFDYAHSGKPIILFAPDFLEYSQEIRGLYLDMNMDLPGPLIVDESDLFYTLTNLEQMNEDYANKYATFKDEYCQDGSGNSSAEVLEYLLERGKNE